MVNYRAVQQKWFCLAIGLCFFLPNSGCSRQETIKIGFVGELTGRQSDLGVHGRNGVQLAIETWNERGGVAGRPIELIVQDDQGTPEGAEAADQALIEAGVVAIIGHMSSAQTIAGHPVTEEAGMVLMSPVATTPELSGQKDLFFRVVPTHIAQAQALCQHLLEDRDIGRLAIIYDADNEAFTISFAEACTEHYLSLGGEITAEISYSSSAQPDFVALISQLQKSQAEGVLIITSALDAALIAQQTRLQDWPVPLFSSAWAQTDVIIQNGGLAVEDMEFIIAFDVNSPNPVYVDFKTRYEERFGQTPSFAAGEAYETALVLFAALERTGGQAEGLPETLLQTQNFAGLMGNISLDEYGDVARTLFIITIQDGAFQTLPTVIEPK